MDALRAVRAAAGMRTALVALQQFKFLRILLELFQQRFALGLAVIQFQRQAFEF